MEDGQYDKETEGKKVRSLIAVDVRFNNHAKCNGAYDGDGTRTSTLTTTFDENGAFDGSSFTAYYFGGAYEITDEVAKSYYNFAGQTIMKDENGELTYFLTDHLGSVVATTDDEGNLINQQRYLPFGGVRTNIGSIVQTDYGYTGQRNLDEDIGLMDYKFRFYSPTLGRFISPDSIIPRPMNPQAWNRFSYVYNRSIIFNDPSGHNPACGPDGMYCGGGKWVNPKYPDKVDTSSLSGSVYKGSGVSGQMMYQFYLDTWAETPDGSLSIKKFAQMILSHEFLDYQSSSGSLYITSSYKENLQTAMINWYWGLQPRGSTIVTPASILNWMAAFGSAGLAYRAGTITGTKADSLANEILYKVFSLQGIQRYDPTVAGLIGNLSMFPKNTIENASQGNNYDQYIDAWGLDSEYSSNPAYILSACQDAFFKGEYEYVNQQCIPEGEPKLPVP